MNLLLHICCAPCATGVIKSLSEDRELFVTGYYYNPNIHPAQENEARRKSVISLSQDEGFQVLIEEDILLDYWKEKLSGDKEKRCGVCYALRIDRMAKTAKSKGFDAFSTSLLISPWQDHERIKSLCQAAADRYHVDFFYRDFRPWYREGKNEAWRRGYCMQKYCGCIFSYQESDHKKKPKYDFG